MHVISLSTVSAGGFSWQPRFGGHAFVVIAKATYDLRPGRARLAEIQDELNIVDSHYSHDTRGSIYSPSDMVPFKEQADVTLVGDAHSPSERGSRSLIARLSVGSVDKKVAVYADRWLDAKGRTCRGEPFTSMPLRYERAAGGRTTDNPAGLDSTRRPGSGDRRPLPNLLRLGGRGKGAARSLGPACFGPVAPSWPQRRRLLGGAACYWTDEGWRQRPLPPGFDTTYFNHAPPDQRLDELTADLQLVLEHVHPEWPRLACTLPGQRPRAFVERGGAAREVTLQADSLWIDMTRSVCTLTWRGSLSLASDDEEGRALVALEQPGEPLTYPDVVELDCLRGQRPSAVRLIEGQESVTSPCPEPRQSAPSNEMPEAAELPMAVNGEETVVIPQPMPSSPLPFVPPAIIAVVPEPQAMATLPQTPPPMADGVDPHTSATPTSRLKAVKSTASPWAPGALTAARHVLCPPPSPGPERETAPPLMLVPPPVPSGPGDDPAQPPVPEGPAARQRGPLGSSFRLELLGHQADDVDRIHQRWIELVDEEPDEAVARSLQSAFDSVPPLAPAEARRRLVRIMSKGETMSPASMGAALREGVDDDGLFTPPLVMVNGTLRFPFAERDRLEATIACVAPYLRRNETLGIEVEAAKPLLADSLAGGSPDAAAEQTSRIRRATSLDPTVDAALVATRVERMLLDRRAYQRRELLGGTWTRALLVTGETTLPCYLPECLTQALPLYSTFPARLVCELYPRQDQHEDNPQALKALALGRVITHEEAG
ncbi:MAG: DUF2169 domain-containing protein [Deltaproteobacteria bacterium]|nr:DUF2169 domain-containing protein [Deltaproteobacteria bacterium]